MTHRRVVPRRGQGRAAADGLGDAVRDGPARDRPRDRRAAGQPRLHAERVRGCCRSCSSAPAAARDGSITALITVLVEGDDMNEPVADAVRGILDGHVVLDRASSPTATTTRRSTCCSAVSRVAPAITDAAQARAAAGRLRDLLATYRAKEDLISIGAYQRGLGSRASTTRSTMIDAARRVPAPAAPTSPSSRRSPSAGWRRCWPTRRCVRGRR